MNKLINWPYSSSKIFLYSIIIPFLLMLVINQNCFADESVFVGVLEPTEKETIVSKVEAILVKNVEEGAIIKKGEVLYQLDTIDYEERKIQIESELRKLEAEHNVNKLTFENRLIDAKQKVSSKKVSYEIAALIYQDLLNGPNLADVKVSEEKVKLAQIILENTKLEYSLTKKLFDGGYVSKDDVNSLEFKVKNEEENLKLLKLEHELTKAGPTSIQVEEAKIINDIRKKEYDNMIYQLASLEKSYAELLQYQAREFKNRNKKLDRVNQNIADCVMLAPIDGTVFYERFPWGEKIPIGKYVWEGLSVRSIANLTNMSVKIKIAVELIDQYSLGQKAVIEIFSTGQKATGEITKIFQIQEDEFADTHNKTKEVLGTSNKKIFVVKVKMIDSLPNLKPGMTAKVIFDKQETNDKK